MDFNKIKNIDEYFYLKKDEYLILCQIVEIDEIKIIFKINGYHHSLNYYPYISDLKMIIKNSNDLIYAGNNYQSMYDMIYLNTDDEESILELNIAINFLNDILKQVTLVKDDHIDSFETIGILTYKLNTTSKCLNYVQMRRLKANNGNGL